MRKPPPKNHRVQAQDKLVGGYLTQAFARIVQDKKGDIMELLADAHPFYCLVQQMRYFAFLHLGRLKRLGRLGHFKLSNSREL